MALEVKEKYRHGRSGKTSTGYSAEYEFVVLATNEEPNGLELRIIDLPDIPNIGDSVSAQYLGVLCNDLKAEEIDEGNYANWKVIATYETPTDDNSSEQTDNPLNDPVTVSGSDIRRSVVAEFAYERDSDKMPTKYISNSLGDPFDPPIIDEEVDGTITITKKYAGYDFSLISEFTNTINLAQTRCGGVNIDKGKGLIKAIRPNSGTRNGINYVEVTFEIAISSRGWDREVSDNGVNMKDLANSTPQKLVKRAIKYSDLGVTDDTKDDFVTEPQRLDLNGQPVTDPFISVPSLIFKTKKSLNWNTLDIPERRG